MCIASSTHRRTAFSFASSPTMQNFMWRNARVSCGPSMRIMSQRFRMISRSRFLLGCAAAAALESMAAAAQPSRKRDRLIIRNLCDMMRMEGPQETRAFLHMKFCIVGLDAKEKAVRRCVLEAMHIENGMVRVREAVECEHAENRTERGAQDGELKGHGNKCRPAVQRAAPNIHG